tara:strand:+ start:15798 stop:16136 length:339 start_codon:yes stop_codon:yes gene_type:complete
VTVPTDYPSLLSIHRPIHVRYIAIHKTLTTFLLHSQEIDRNSDLVRSCLKAVVGLTIRLPRDVTETEDFDEFITKVVRSEKVVKQFEEAVAAAGGWGSRYVLVGLSTCWLSE